MLRAPFLIALLAAPMAGIEAEATVLAIHDDLSISVLSGSRDIRLRLGWCSFPGAKLAEARAALAERLPPGSQASLWFPGETLPEEKPAPLRVTPAGQAEPLQDWAWASGLAAWRDERAPADAWISSARERLQPRPAAAPQSSAAEASWQRLQTLRSTIIAREIGPNRWQVLTPYGTGEQTIAPGDILSRNPVDEATISEFFVRERSDQLRREQAFAEEVARRPAEPVAETPPAKPAVPAPVATPAAAAGGGIPFASQLRNGVVMLAVEVDRQRQALGSGFFVSGHGHLVTNAHVVGRNRQARVFWDAGLGRQSEVFQVVAIDTDRDLAVLAPQSSIETWTHLELATEATVGEDIIAVGYPQGTAIAAALSTQAVEQSMTKGAISALRRERADAAVKYMQFDARIAKGSSGGPVVDARSGKVVGVVCAAFVPSDNQSKGDEINLAIPVHAVRSFLEKHGISLE